MQIPSFHEKLDPRMLPSMYYFPEYAEEQTLEWHSFARYLYLTINFNSEGAIAKM